jgi:small multidrug resistance pump
MTLSKCVAALIAAVSIELIATTFLSLSNGFQRPVIGFIAIIGYGVSYYFLSVALHKIHIGVAYAIWSAVGILSITLIQTRYFEYLLPPDAWFGIALVITGTLILNLAIKSNK